MRTERPGWQRVTIGSLGKVITGKTPPTKRRELYGAEYPFITPTDISDDSHVARPTRFLSEEGRQYQSRYLVPKNTVCFTCIASIGKTCIATEPSFTNQQINSVVVDATKHDYRFIYHLLRHETERIRALASGAAAPIINKSAFSDIELVVPSLPIQRKIASILGAYDDLIKNNLRRIEILEQIARLIYQEWFVKFRFPGHEKVRMTDSKLGKIPEGWSISPMGERFETILGGTPSRSNPAFWDDGRIPWINSGKVNELRVIQPSEFITEEGLRHSSAKIMPKRTTVVAITGATLGQVSLLEIDACANQSVVGIYDPEGRYPEWIYLALKRNIAEIIQRASGGAQQHINKGIIDDVTLAVPPQPLAGSFATTIRPIFDLIAALLRENESLRRARDLLLPNLISGQLDVGSIEVQ